MLSDKEKNICRAYHIALIIQMFVLFWIQEIWNLNMDKNISEVQKFLQFLYTKMIKKLKIEIVYYCKNPE